MSYEDYLLNLPYYEHLSDLQKSTISSNWQRKSFKKGEIIYGTTNESLGQFLILSGSIRTYILSEEGREITLFVLHENDTCVLSAGRIINQINFDTQMVAQTDVEILELTLSAFWDLSEENVYVKCYIYELLAKRFSQVMWVVQEILFKCFDRRLATFLVNEYERTGSKQINMTHEQIAQHTNSAREVVARMLKRFFYDGYLDYQRGTITLIDIDALKMLK